MKIMITSTLGICLLGGCAHDSLMAFKQSHNQGSKQTIWIPRQ
ncbi:hypothetical protein [Helicobacter sp. 11S03491-1]|nr:hypothetical protein [Helicobacter sp. 11S03491-1]